MHNQASSKEARGAINIMLLQLAKTFILISYFHCEKCTSKYLFLYVTMHYRAHTVNKLSIFELMSYVVH